MLNMSKRRRAEAARSLAASRKRYRVQAEGKIVRGTFDQAIGFICQIAATNEIISYSVRAIPEKDEMVQERGNQGVRRWAVAILCCHQIDEADDEPTADSVEDFDSLLARINQHTDGQDACNIQISRDASTGEWTASILFPFKLALQANID